MRELKIFVSAPSDVTAEREKVRSVVSSLEPLAAQLGIALKLDAWEKAAPRAGVARRALAPESWDVFIGVLWHRFGTPPAREPSAAASGAEEEFTAALRASEKGEKPRVMIYLCTRPVPLDALDPDQLKRVRKFSADFGSRWLSRTFDTTETFERALLEDLRRVLLEYAEEVKEDARRKSGTPRVGRGLLEYGEEVKAEAAHLRMVQTYAPSIPDNLPWRAPFFGREREMAYVMRALSPEDRSWGVLVDGMGGIGKTALAVEAAHRCKERRLFDSYVFVSAKQNLLTPGGIQQLSPPARVLDDFLSETARVLGQPEIARLEGDDRRQALIKALHPARALLVYDNLETLSWEEQAGLVDFLRTLPPGCKAITTSRRREAEGAIKLRLEKLDWEAARAIVESEMAPDPRLANKLRDADEARLRELYEETGGSPLALMHTLGLLRVRAELTLEGALGLLRGSDSPDIEKLHQFIFQEARRELSANDQTALRALSFFVPSATLEAWTEVSALSRSALEVTVDSLSALSLVNVPPGGERYGLHPLTRRFVHGELLADGGLAVKTGWRFADYWVSYAKQYGGGEFNYRTFNLLSAEWANLDAAAEWLWQTAGVSEGKVGDERAARALDNLSRKLGNATGPLFYFGRWDQHVLLNSRAYEAMVALGDWKGAGWCAYQIVYIYTSRENNKEAAMWAERCEEAWARSGGKRERAAGLQARALVAGNEKDYDTAEGLLREVLGIVRELGSEDDVANTLHMLGVVESSRGRLDAAENYFRESLKLYEKVGSQGGIAMEYASLGVVAVERKSWGEARALLEKAHSLTRELGRQDLLLGVLHRLALTYEAEGRYQDARSLAQEALALSEKLQPNNPNTPLQRLLDRLKAKAGG